MQEVLLLLKAHLGEVVLGFLLIVSEIMGSSEKFKHSAIFQLLVGLLKSKKDELDKK